MNSSKGLLPFSIYLPAREEGGEPGSGWEPGGQWASHCTCLPFCTLSFSAWLPPLPCFLPYSLPSLFSIPCGVEGRTGDGLGDQTDRPHIQPPHPPSPFSQCIHVLTCSPDIQLDMTCMKIWIDDAAWIDPPSGVDGRTVWSRRQGEWSGGDGGRTGWRNGNATTTHGISHFPCHTLHHRHSTCAFLPSFLLQPPFFLHVTLYLHLHAFIPFTFYTHLPFLAFALCAFFPMPFALMPLLPTISLLPTTHIPTYFPTSLVLPGIW